MPSKRILEPKLLDYYLFCIESHQALNNLFDLERYRLDGNGALATVSAASDGGREATGNNDGRIVELTQMTVDGLAQHEPYCMATVMSRIAFVEFMLNVKSDIEATELCMDVWNWAVKNNRTIEKGQHQMGDIVIWQHGNSSSGHTGIVTEVGINGRFMCSEGNTTAGEKDGKIVREGGGFYVVERTLADVGDMKLKGFVRAF